MSLDVAASQALGGRRQFPKLILTNGQSYRSITVTPLLIAFVSVLIIGILVWCIGLSGFIYFRDDVVRTLIHKQAITVERYEDKITALRLQVDSIRSRQFINQDSFSGAIEDLRTRQEEIESNQSEILGVVQRAKEAGIRRPADTAPLTTGSLAPTVEDRSGSSVTLASHRLVGDSPVSRPAIPPREALVFADTPDTTLTRVARQIDEELRGFANNQSNVLNSIETESASKAAELRSVFDRIKLDKKRFGLDLPSAVGGPFIPVKDAGKMTEVSLQIARIDQNLAVIDDLRTTIASLPIRRPLPEAYPTSSGFGTRLDPFLKRRAFHAGLDFRAPIGTKVHVTAAGVVTKAGWHGGYGRMVEVRHRNGLTTRYGHLSRISVTVGQSVSQGQVVGLVGSTGRSTGPHLHYETRIDDEAVNPIRFLTAL